MSLSLLSILRSWHRVSKAKPRYARVNYAGFARLMYHLRRQNSQIDAKRITSTVNTTTVQDLEARWRPMGDSRLNHPTETQLDPACLGKARVLREGADPTSTYVLSVHS